MTSETRHPQTANRPWSRGGLSRPAAAETSAVSLLDTLSEVVFRTDSDGRWTYLNHAWTTLTGYEVGPSLGARFLDYIHPDEMEHALAAFADAARDGIDHCRYEVRYRTRRGGHRRVHVRVNVLRGPAGELVGSTGTIVDVSGTPSATQAVGEHASLLESMTADGLDDLPTGVAIYDRELRLRRSSRTVDRLVGRALRAGEALEHLGEATRPADWRSRALGGEWGLIPVALRTGRTQLGDLELDLAGGSGRSLRACVVPFEQGGEELAALMLSDVTDLRRAERRQAGLARLGQLALAGRGLPALFAEAVDLIVASLEVAVCEVIRHEPAGERPAPPAPSGPASRGDLASLVDQVSQTAPTALGPGPIYLTGPLAIEVRSLLHLALDVEEPVVANNLDACPHLRSGWAGAAGARAALAARVGPAGAPFGVLVAASTLPRRFTGEEASFVRAVAAILTAAFDREQAERTSRQRQEESERARAWLAATAEITAGVLVSDQSQQQARLLLAALARKVTHADVGAVALPDEAGNLVATEVDCAPHRHSDPETLHGLALALEAAENQAEFLAGQPVHVTGLDDSDAWSGPIALTASGDDTSDPAAAGTEPAGTASAGTASAGSASASAAPAGAGPVGDGPDLGEPIPPIPAEPRLREALVVPLTAADGAMGALVLGNSPGGSGFDAHDPELAGAFGEDAATAIRLAEDQRERARLAVFEDRERIARDLHDLVIQKLFAIGLHLQSLSRAVGDVTAARLNAAINGLDATIDDIRRTIFRIQPAPAGA